MCCQFAVGNPYGTPGREEDVRAIASSKGNLTSQAMLAQLDQTVARQQKKVRQPTLWPIHSFRERKRSCVLLAIHYLESHDVDRRVHTVVKLLASTKTSSYICRFLAAKWGGVESWLLRETSLLLEMYPRWLLCLTFCLFWHASRTIRWSYRGNHEC